MILAAFAPQTAGGNLNNAVAVATSNAAASATLPGASGGAYSQIHVDNVSAAWLWLNFGAAGLTAAAIPATTRIAIIGVAPNQSRVFTIDPSFTTVSYILSTGTGTAVFSRGEGL